MNATLDCHLKDMCFYPSINDPCIYVGEDGFYIGVYVDDMILASLSDQHMRKVKDALSQRFDIKDLGRLHHFLGVIVDLDEEKGCAWIGQPIYTSNLLEKHGMNNCKPIATPVDVGTKHIKGTNEDEIFDQQVYQSAIGSLMYLSISTRPDISYAVGNLAKFSSKPTKIHWMALKCVLHYLKDTMNYGISYKREESNGCVGFSDADWAGDINDRKSTSG